MTYVLLVSFLLGNALLILFVVCSTIRLLKNLKGNTTVKIITPIVDIVIEHEENPTL